MSAHKKINIKINSLKFIHFGFFGIAIIFLGIIFYVFAQTSRWDGNSKLTYVVLKDEQVDVVVVDPMYKEVTTIVIPGDTLVEMARGLGETKIKNVYNIGVNEGLDGQLLYETTTYSLALPAYHYVYDNGQNFGSDSFFEGMKSVFLPSKTDFTLTEKVKLFLFSWTNRDVKRVTINLNQTSYLRKIVLTDGSDGYVKTPFMPQSVQSLFDINDVDGKGEIFTITIVNYSGSTVNLDNISSAFASLGGKVISVKQPEETKKSYTKDSNRIFCELTIKDKKLGSELSRFFPMCTAQILDQNDKTVDMEILTLE